MKTFDEYTRSNPESYIPNGRSLDHDMEYDEHTGFERCNGCGDYENDVDDICQSSDYAVETFVDWEDYAALDNYPGMLRMHLIDDQIGAA